MSGRRGVYLSLMTRPESPAILSALDIGDYAMFLIVTKDRAVLRARARDGEVLL